MTRYSQQRRLFFAFILILIVNALVSYFIYQIVDDTKVTANTAERKTDKLVPQVTRNTRIIKKYLPSKKGDKGERGLTIRGPRGRKGKKGDTGKSGTKVIEIRRTLVIERVGPPGPKGEKGNDGVTRTVPQKCNPLLGYYCIDPETEPYSGVP